MEVVGVATAAVELNISENRVRQLIYLGKLPAQRLGREWAITRPDLDKFKAKPRPEGRPKKLTIKVDPATTTALAAPRQPAATSDNDTGQDIPY
jgi:excisionase family DNA binding protein